jgi:hypothetical protein
MTYSEPPSDQAGARLGVIRRTAAQGPSLALREFCLRAGRVFYGTGMHSLEEHHVGPRIRARAMEMVMVMVMGLREKSPPSLKVLFSSSKPGAHR